MPLKPTASRLLLLTTTILLYACGGEKTSEPAAQAAAKPTVRSTIISAFEVQRHSVEVIERSVGGLEALIRPEVSAEVEGRYAQGFVITGQKVTPGQVLAELDTEDYQIAARGANAEVAQLTALLSNQRRTVARYTKLSEDKLISIDRLDEAKAQLDSLAEQLKAAKERLKQKERGLNKTRVLSAYSGIVDAELASPGDFLKVGDPIFRIIKVDYLRARLPLPETLAKKLSVGLEIRLVSPLSPDTEVVSEIQEIRPTVGTSNRAVDVLTIVENPGNWQPGASVTGQIVLERRESAVVVPEAAVVLRPAGKVVYVIENNIAQQRVVSTGEYIVGKKVEIISGLAEGEIIAVDGAGFLTDGAPVLIRKAGE